MKYFSYGHLLKQRAVLIGLTLGLTTVFLGMMIELVVSSQKTTIPPAVQKLTTPLNPQLDIKTVEKIESFSPITLEEAKRNLTQNRVAAPTPTPTTSVATPSGQFVTEPSSTGGELPVSEQDVSGASPTPTPEPEIRF